MDEFQAWPEPASSELAGRVVKLLMLAVVVQMSGIFSQATAVPVGKPAGTVHGNDSVLLEDAWGGRSRIVAVLTHVKEEAPFRKTRCTRRG